MASEKFKKLIISEGVTLLNDGEMPMCSIDPTRKAAYKVQCGNHVLYAAKENLAAAKTQLSQDESVDEDARIASQDGPNDLNRTLLDKAAF